MKFSNLRKSIFYLQEAIRNDHPNNKVLVDALDLLVGVKEDIKLTDIQEISKTYHDRLVCSMTSICGFSSLTNEDLTRNCPICGRKTISTISIEHDSQDHSKDLSICLSCYTDLHVLWKTNSPKKLSPI